MCVLWLKAGAEIQLDIMQWSAVCCGCV